MFLVFSVGLLLLAGGAQVAEASGYGTFSAFGTVTIGDGTVHSDASIDWGDAAMRSYTLNFTGDLKAPCNVYVKNNETHLLIRVEWVDPNGDPGGVDGVMIYFDDQSSLGLGKYDDAAWMYDTKLYKDLFGSRVGRGIMFGVEKLMELLTTIGIKIVRGTSSSLQRP